LRSIEIITDMPDRSTNTTLFREGKLLPVFPTG